MNRFYALKITVLMNLQKGTVTVYFPNSLQIKDKIKVSNKGENMNIDLFGSIQK